MSAAPLFTHAHPDMDIQRPFDAAVVIRTLVRETLTRAVESVYAQDLDGGVQILIGIDDPKAEFALLDHLVEDCPDHMALTIFNPGYSTLAPNGGLYDAFGGIQLSVLTYLAHTRHVAYLDDDNWWAPSHLSDLKAAIEGYDWAFALRWFVDPDTSEPLCVDDWESVGPGGGIFTKGVFKGRRYYDGFVDPNPLMIDKLACDSAVAEWNRSLPGEPGTNDRVIFDYLRKNHHFNCTFNPTVFYVIDPKDPIHRSRSVGIATRQSGGQSEADIERRLSHLPPLIQESSRKWLLRKLTRNAIGALVGVHDGGFAERLLDATRPAKLHLIDSWEDERYQQILTRFEVPIGEGRVQAHRGEALPAITNLTDDDLDWVYPTFPR